MKLSYVIILIFQIQLRHEGKKQNGKPQIGKEVSNLVGRAVVICLYIFSFYRSERKMSIFKWAKDSNIGRSMNGL